MLLDILIIANRIVVVFSMRSMRRINVKTWIFSLLILAAMKCVAAPAELSIVSLIATPQNFNKKQVRIVGFVRVEFEGNAVYLHRDDFLEGVRKNGFWLDVENIPSSQLAEINGRYALVEGEFSSEERGHLGMWSGSILKITRLEALTPPK